MKTVYHSADSRGKANHGWLNSHHSFSFANYQDPERMKFGLLRVLNDDTVAGGQGFGRHPHENMEIISIPLSGKLRHEDSLGTSREITTGEIQVMSAGTGVFHSEFNASETEEVKFLQLWIFPKVKNIAPRYDQRNIQTGEINNGIERIVSPIDDPADSIKINQDAYLSIATLSDGKQLEYQWNNPANGVYAFVLSGNAAIAGQDLQSRDALGIWDAQSISIQSIGNSKVLLIEVPMNSNR